MRIRSIFLIISIFLSIYKLCSRYKPEYTMDSILTQNVIKELESITIKDNNSLILYPDKLEGCVNIEGMDLKFPVPSALMKDLTLDLSSLRKFYKQSGSSVGNEGYHINYLLKDGTEGDFVFGSKDFSLLNRFLIKDDKLYKVQWSSDWLLNTYSKNWIDPYLVPRTKTLDIQKISYNYKGKKGTILKQNLNKHIEELRHGSLTILKTRQAPCMTLNIERSVNDFVNLEFYENEDDYILRIMDGSFDYATELSTWSFDSLLTSLSLKLDTN